MAKRKRYRHKSNLTKYILKHGYNQTSFARLIEMPRKTIVEYCTGRNLPPNHVARRICFELNVYILEVWPEYHKVQQPGYSIAKRRR